MTEHPVTFHGGPLDGHTAEASGVPPAGSTYVLAGSTYVHAVHSVPGDVDEQLHVRPDGDPAEQLRPAAPPTTVRPAAGTPSPEPTRPGRKRRS